MSIRFEFFGNSHSASAETITFPNDDLLVPINDRPQPAHVLKIPIIIDKVTHFTLVDTGASLSILDADLLSETDQLQKRENIFLRGASGKLINVIGTVEKEFILAGKLISHTFAVVPNFKLKTILGLDFLVKFRAIINCATKIVYFRQPANAADQQREAESPNPPPHATPDAPENITACAQFSLAKQADIAAKNTADIQLTISAKLHPGSYLAFPNENLLAKHHVYAPCLVFEADKIPEKIPLRNVSLSTSRLYQKQNIYKIFKMSDLPGIEILPITQDQPESDIPNKSPLDEVKINPELSTEENEKVCKILKQYSHLFTSNVDDLPTTNKIQHVIRMKEGTHPIKIRPFREAAAQKEEMRKEINRLLDKKIIQPSASPWSSPAFIIKKKSGESRLIIDYRAINARTDHQTYFLPLISDILASFHGAKYFATLDLFQAFFQVPLDEKSRVFTAFNCSTGSYEFLRAPFGLQGCPATFQNLTDSILSDMKWISVFNYLDDIIIIGKTFDEFIDNLVEVLKRFEDANLRFKPSKCSIGFQELSILGWKISQTGISVDPERASILSKLKTPKNIAQLYRSLGMFSFYRRLIKNFAEIAAPLYALCKKDIPFIWSEIHENAFRAMLDSLASPQVLAHFDPAAETFVEVDTSKLAIGAVLSQLDENGFRRPVCFASRALSATEQKLNAATLECLGLTWSILHFKYFLYAKKFTVLSDSHAICCIQKLKDPYGRIARLLLRLQEFEFTMCHISGIKHKCPDFLSRQEAD
jgi:RNase H-like domain found in reverse transcriptase/Reverse transcriptase (RNA-dependent DNA polymerase)